MLVSKLVGVLIVLGVAPAPAAAQPAFAAFSNGMTGQLARVAPKDAKPISLAARQAVTRVAFKRSAPRMLRAAPRQDDEVPAVSVPGKDAWSDDEGVRFTATKIAYTRRF